MPYTNSVLTLLENRALEDPDKTAFKDPDNEITFGALCLESKRLGTFLCKKIKSKEPVAFYMEKSVNALSGMMGAVYAGGFYSFIDVRQPVSRAVKILETLRPSLMLTDRASFEKASELAAEYKIETIVIEDLLEDKSIVPDEDLLSDRRRNALDTDPLYVNFTSGSTGVPKGVTVSHRSVIEFISYFTDIFGIEKTDVLGNQAPFDFDVSVKDIYSGLMTGAEVVIIPREYFSNPTMLMDHICDNNVTVLVWAVSAMCFVSIMNGLEYRYPDSIRMVMFSGEVMPIKHLKHWKSFFPDAKYVNLYGPTEITCNCTYHVLDKEYGDTEAIPAGIPFPNEKVFLLDENDKEIKEAGIEGEICVSGTCLALGYYNDKERTEASFVKNPLISEYNELMYRTGDLGKWDENGLLYYTSRKDHQIKHMGQRIELGEIEAAVTSRDGVSRSCCIYDNEKKKIVLFYSGDVDKKGLLNELKETLPPYMIPSNARQMDELPVNKNGKIDRAKLLEIYSGK
ncbi:MAG: amino acid adenylation domain-containing protein [Lachnospiraceae bacterium]|nr:amino acid adenylation domain-containing protein [Lachnospiraceae bacterium]